MPIAAAPPPTTAPNLPNPGRRAVVSTLVLGVLLVNLALYAVVTLSLLQGRDEVLQHARQTAGNVALALDHDLSGIIDRLDQAMGTVADEIDRQRNQGVNDPQTLDRLMNLQASRVPEILGLRVSDENGIIRHAAREVVTASASIADRPRFQRLKQDDKAGLVIEGPLKGRVSGRVIVVFARRLNYPDGRFAGEVHASVGLDNLILRFRGLDLGSNGNVGLWTNGPSFLARLTQNRGVELGDPDRQEIHPSADLAKIIAEGSEIAAYHTRSGVDGIEREFAVRRVHTLPLYLLVGLSDEDSLTPWMAQLRSSLLICGLFSLLSLLSAWLIFRGWRLRQQAAKALDLQHQDYVHLLEEARQTAEEARRHSEQILASVGDGICGIDSQGRIIFINDQARQMFGWQEGEGLGYELHALTHHHRADGTVFPHEDCPIRLIASGQISQDTIAHTIQDIFWRKTGDSFPVEYTASPMLSAGHVGGAVVVFRDVSERMAMEAELRRSNRDLEQFAYVASHDLRQPLRVIGSYLSLLERGLTTRLSDEEKSFFGFAIGGAKRMDALIQGLLDYSRIGRNTAPTLTNLSQPLSEALANLALAAKDAGAEIVTPASLPSVMGDPIELMRLFQNLIGNAIKYRRPDCPPKVEIGCSDAGKCWQVWVQDNGIGIPDKDCERIFGIFQRLVSQQDYEGTGIGLAVCKKIMEGLGGSIQVAPPPDDLDGTRFVLRFPKESPGRQA